MTLPTSFSPWRERRHYSCIVDIIELPSPKSVGMKIDMHTHILPDAWPDMEGIELLIKELVPPEHDRTACLPSLSASLQPEPEGEFTHEMRWKNGDLFRKAPVHGPVTRTHQRTSVCAGGAELLLLQDSAGAVRCAWC
jgi:hypothetical protein